MLVACCAEVFHRSRLRKQSPSHACDLALKFVGFYFREVCGFLFTHRYVTGKILAEESLEGEEVVFAVKTVCLVLRLTMTVVQKENLARTENRCLKCSSSCCSSS